MRCSDKHLGGCAMKFMTAAVTFECQTNTRGSQVVSVRPMGWAVYRLYGHYVRHGADDSDRFCQESGVGEEVAQRPISQVI